MVERYGQPGLCDAVTFLQTIEHVANPAGVCCGISGCCSAPGGAVYVSTPNLLTIAAQGAEKSDNPWHLREYRACEFRALCESVFDSVEIYGLYHAGRLRIHNVALSLGWDGSTAVWD